MAILPDGLDFLCIAFLFTVGYVRGVRRAPESSLDVNSRCSADAQNIQLGLIQTHVPQCQPGKYTRKNDEDRYERSEDDLLGLREFPSFGICVVAMADAAMEASATGKMVVTKGGRWIGRRCC